MRGITTRRVIAPGVMPVASDDKSSMPRLVDVGNFPDEQPTDDRRWMMLFPADYENFVRDMNGNLGIMLDIEQAGEVIRLSTEILASLSHRETDGDDVIEDLIDGLKAELEADREEGDT